MILVAPDKFKGTLTAAEACDIISRALRSCGVSDDIKEFPMADGGEGTAEVMARLRGYGRMTIEATDSSGRPITATYYAGGDEVAVDSAAVLGLTMLAESERNPMRTSSASLGRLLAEVIRRHRPRRITLGVGGTATCDGGAGMLGALGARFYDGEGRQIDGPICPAMIKEVSRVDFSRMAALPEMTILCDVDVPLLAEDGAPQAMTFARQKGLAEGDRALMRQALERWRALSGIECGPFTGAGGGVVAYFVSKCPTELGADHIIRRAGLDRLPLTAIITGEGRIDEQTMMGKVAGRLCRFGRSRSLLTVGIGGCVAEDFNGSGLFDRVFSTMEDTDSALTPAARLELTARRVANYLHSLAKFH